MQVRIRSDGTDDMTLHQLYRWLSNDSELAYEGTVEGRAPSGTGQMGALEVIDVTLTHVTSLGSLVMAYASWRAARRDSSSVTFERDGVSVTVQDASPQTIARIMDALSGSGEESGGAA